jgi:hypothetical protein
MGNRDVVTIYRIMMRPVRFRGGLQMGYDLMAEEIKVDPLLRASPLRAAQQASIERPRSLKIIDRKGNVEGSKWHPEVSFRPSYVFD